MSTEVQDLEDKVNSDDDVYMHVDTAINCYCDTLGLDASKYEFYIEIKETHDNKR